MRKLRVPFSFVLLFILVGFYQNCSEGFRLNSNGEAYEGYGDTNPDGGNSAPPPDYHIECAPKALPNMGLSGKMNVRLDGSITSVQIFEAKSVLLKTLNSQDFSGLRLKAPTDLGADAQLLLFQPNDNLDQLQIRVQMNKTAQVIDEQWSCK